MLYRPTYGGPIAPVILDATARLTELADLESSIEGACC